MMLPTRIGRALGVAAVLVALLAAPTAATEPRPSDPTPDDADSSLDGPRPTDPPRVRSRRAPDCDRRPPPRIVAVGPNPTAPEDRGEVVVLALVGPTNLSGWRLSDGETTATLGDRTVSGRVAVSPEPAAARNRTDHPVVGVDSLRLSNAGERIALRRGGRVVGAVTYRDAPEGQRFRSTGGRVRRAVCRPTAPSGGPGDSNGSDGSDGSDANGSARGRPAVGAPPVETAGRPPSVGTARSSAGGILAAGPVPRRRWTWRSPLRTDRPVATVDPSAVRAFLLPDAPDVAVDLLRSADRRVLLAGYTLTSRRVVRTLRAAADRGVRVRVLVDAAPVGGLSRRGARLLDSLVAAGVSVRVYGGDRAPYDFHHPKYAVVDDRAVVLTENWKPAGTGGRSSRGWGVVLGSGVAAELAALFETDSRPATTVRWDRYRSTVSPSNAPVATGSYPTRFDPRRLPVEGARLLVAPDNAAGAIVDLIDGAEESVLVQQLSVERGRLLRATVRAARRGVRVRVLLSSAWYVREQNRRLADRLNRLAREEGLDLRARLAEPRSRYEKVHAKGVVVDDRVVVGSLNWNPHSARRNREVAVVLRGDRVASYYRRAFRADWRGGRWRLPAGMLAAVLVAAAAAAAVARRRIAFDAGLDPVGPGDDRIGP